MQVISREVLPGEISKCVKEMEEASKCVFRQSPSFRLILPGSSEV